mmetsp:Transcript_9579/g.18677  ORF Transcript_9579/g.18677 Transcript_9579/m.18677 type:complete len:476 (+) Transcript_9579:1355-2782(+)
MLQRKSAGQGSKGQFNDAALARLEKLNLSVKENSFVRSPLSVRVSPNRSPLRSALASPKFPLKLHEGRHRRSKSDQPAILDSQGSTVCKVPLLLENRCKALLRRHNSIFAEKPVPETAIESGKAMTKEEIVEELSNHFDFSQDAPPTRLEYYRLLKLLGKGAFGKVILGVHRLTGMHVAIKAIEKARLDSEYAKRKVFQEVFLLKRIRHRNVVRILEVFESAKHVLIVMEFTSGGDLLQFVKLKKRLSEAEARLIFRQIVDGAIAIHSHGVLHRDFKLDNILLDGNYSTIKICDFGVSRILKRGQVCFDKCGTPAYIAPEIIAEQGYEGYSVDTWSIGVMLYAMVTGTVPFRAPSIQELHKLVLKGKYSLPDHVSPMLADLLSQMMCILPNNRISLQKVLSHPWLTYEALSSEPCVAPSFKVKKFRVEPRVLLDEFLLAKVEALGWPQQVLIDCLTANEMNYGTAAYFLLHLALN